MNINYQEYERNEAYKYQLDRLTPEQKISLNAKENNCNRKMTPWEITQIFNLEPTGEKKVVKRRLSDEIENSHWSENL